MKMNEVQMIGRLTKQPQVTKTDKGVSVSSFTLAVTRDFKNPNGDYDADFVPCVVWREQAENLVKYQKKGKLIAVTGRIQTRSYENNEGQKVYVTEIVVRSIQYLEKIERQENAIPQEAPVEPPVRHTTADHFAEYPDDAFPPMENGRVSPENIY